MSGAVLPIPTTKVRVTIPQGSGPPQVVDVLLGLRLDGVMEATDLLELACAALGDVLSVELGGRPAILEVVQLITPSGAHALGAGCWPLPTTLSGAPDGLTTTAPCPQCGELLGHNDVAPSDGHLICWRCGKRP